MMMTVTLAWIAYWHRGLPEGRVPGSPLPNLDYQQDMP